MTLNDLEVRFAGVSAEGASHQDQQLGMVACHEALVAARRGNYGVGAVLVNPRGAVVAQGQNAVFYPHFRSDLHAEMVVMNAFEERHPEVDTMRGYTLLSSIEPCPMCFARLLAAGVQTVKFLAGDAWGGMVNHRQHLPDAWQRLGQRQAIGQAKVSESLRRFALDVFLLNLDACRQRLSSR
jgi:tRNA(Arg) A34 adenosine deaminase TadA